MATNNQASDSSEHDREVFEDAVRKELKGQGFREIARPADDTWLWQHGQAKVTVVGVTRDRDRWSVPTDDPVDEAVLLVGGFNRTDQMYLFEDAIWCWYDAWDSVDLRQRLADSANRAKDCVDGRGVDGPQIVSFREMLCLAADDPSRSDLERRFSPMRIESTLQELFKVRDQFLADLRGSGEEFRREPLRRAAQSVEPWASE